MVITVDHDNSWFTYTSSIQAISGKIGGENKRMDIEYMIPTRKNLVLLLIITALLAACSPEATQPPMPTESLEPPATATALPSPTAFPTPTPTPLPLGGQQTRYEIELTVNYYNRYIQASSRSFFTNRTSVPINEMVFVVYPAIFGNAIFIRSVRIDGSLQQADYVWESHRMVIPLQTPLMPGDVLEIEHDFELYMPDRDGMGGVFSQTDEQLNLSYWFPMIPPYDETEGWVTHEYQTVNSYFVGEHLTFEPSDYDVILQFTDRRENFKIAAGVLPQEENGVIRYQLDLARTFILSISDIFSLEERDVNGTKIQAFTFNAHAPVGKDVADIAVQALTLFSELYGDYERDVLSIVEFNSDIGMEFDGLIFLSPAFYNLYPGNSRSNIHVYTAHEIAHQWFFSLVGNNQALEPWLDEAFATYSERLFYERHYPDDLDWHWDSYILAHNPSGEIDISIYFGGTLFEYRTIVYRNGALFLHELRETIGEEAFFSFLKDYVQRHRYEIVTADDFWGTLREHTDVDLTPLHNKYFTSTEE